MLLKGFDLKTFRFLVERCLSTKLKEAGRFSSIKLGLALNWTVTPQLQLDACSI